MKTCVVPMMSRRTGHQEFEILVYGRSAEELMCVPCAIIDTLARRYPDHQSSIFLLRDWVRR